MLKVVHNLTVTLAAAIIVATLAGCERRTPPPAALAANIRIVSYAPALTQMIIDLDAADLLVGVGENDYAAPADLPVVGNYLDVNTEALLATNPTHVVMMYGKHGTPEVLQRLAGQRHFKLSAYPYPDRITDVMTILHRLPDEIMPDGSNTQGLSDLLNRQYDGRQLRSRLGRQLAAVHDLIEGQKRPRVLMLISTTPPVASGPKTVLDDLLTFALAAQNAVHDSRSSAPTMDREMLIRANPDVVLLLAPKRPPLQSLDDDPRLAVFRGLDIKAVTDNHIALIDDPLVLLPSTSLARITVAMGKAIYPDLADQFDKVLLDHATPSSAIQKQ